MVSRRKILSRSRDDLNLDQTFSPQEEEEDVWYQKEKLYKEHIQEVLDKWTQIDDEIWAKVIVFERNRRVAKAYARAPVLTINGSDDGFDGMRIGLCGFDNPMRDQKTDELKKHIGQGVKIKMDDAGNILIRRYAKSNVYIKSTANNQNEETSIGADILKLPNQALESEKIVKLFDMKKFQSNVNRELRRAYPDRRRLETQCLSAVAFVKSESDILECPIWVLIVNVVAMDMLKSKLPPVSVQRPLVDIKNRPRIPIPDEDPYSVAGNGSGGSSGSSGFGASALSSIMSAHTVQQQLQLQQQQTQQQQSSQSMTNNIGGSSGSNGNIIGGGGVVGNANLHLNNGNVMGAGINGSGHVAATREQLLMQTQQLAHKRSEKPPKLPPRDSIYGHDIPKPDYDDIEVDTRIKLSRGKSDKGKDNKKYDDPYYCGLRARVPNFVKSSTKSAKEHHGTLNNGVATHAAISTLTNQKKTSVMMPMHPAMHAPAPPHMHPHHIQQQQMMAVAAAHAVAQQQQQQQHQHPMHHHAHAHAQQMWQTRSYESGIGIYNHNPTATTTTCTTPALTATATTYVSSTETQQQHLLSLQLQQQQQQQQQQHIVNGNSTLTTQGGLYYPSNAGTSTSTLYNYVAPYSSNEHHHHLQAMSTASSTPNPATSMSAGTSTSSYTSASIPQTSQVVLHQQPSSASSLSSSMPLGLNTTQMTNMTNITNYKIAGGLALANPKHSDIGSENIYGQTRNINFKQVPLQQHHQQQQLPQPQLQHNQYHNNTGGGNADYHHHSHHHRPHQHHSHSRHYQHPHYAPPPATHHHRRQSQAQAQAHGSYMCVRHPHTPARSTNGEFYYKTHDLYYERDDLEMARGHPRHQGRPPGRTSRRSSTATGIDNNCNCVSCYALAPLFGAPTPKRPPRSLSQQQLRQHQILSGAKADPQKRTPHARSMTKWCSDSDVSLLGREDNSQSEETDEYRTYVNRKRNYEQNSSSIFDLNEDFDMDTINHSPLDYKKQLEKPRKSQKFNGYAARHKYRHPSPVKEQQYPLTDGYVDKARLRQLRSPTPQRNQVNKTQNTTKPQGQVKPNSPSSNLLAMRSKSQSTESFFEQPNEEGSLYLYGGRKRIVKAPSTTNIYDRVKANKEEQNLKNAKRFNSQLNLTIEQRKAALNINAADKAGKQQHPETDTLRPLLPPPLWRGAKRMNLKGFMGAKAQTPNNQLDLNNNIITKTENLINNLKNKNQELAKTNNAQNTGAEDSAHEFSNMDLNENQVTTTNINQQHYQKQLQQSITQQQQLSIVINNNRPSRPTSRADVSDMESIYGYLKPRKPRSLSMKKIQIHDY